ncbi:hypothetical protein F5B21DRAFT_502036 [Xylaria acuta]|nr:hypothetical protein F5B21DRAFT_502036 [Xylaria acuta]
MESGNTTSRDVSLPPWPLVNQRPGGFITNPGTEFPTNTGSSTTYYTGITSTVTADGPTVTTVTFPPVIAPTTISCPATTDIAFATPLITVWTTCTNSEPPGLHFWPPYHEGNKRRGYRVMQGVVLLYFHFLGRSLRRRLALDPASRHLAPGPPPLGISQLPSGFQIEGTLPPWPKIITGNEPECETRTAELCTTTAFVSATTTTNGVTTTTATSTSSYCETIFGCSVSGSNSSTTFATVTVSTQTIAPIGTWNDEPWTTNGDDAYSASVFAALSRDLAADIASNNGSVISFTPGATASPTCASGTGCGSQLCTGYWCSASPTGYPLPGSQGSQVGSPRSTQAVRREFRWQSTTTPDGGAPAIGADWVWYEISLGSGVSRFQCDMDPQSNEQIDCDADAPFLFVTFVPKVRCTIPGADARLGQMPRIVNGTTESDRRFGEPGG